MPIRKVEEQKIAKYEYLCKNGKTINITYNELSGEKTINICDEEINVTWDIDMLLDICDIIKSQIKHVEFSNSQEDSKQNESEQDIFPTQIVDIRESSPEEIQSAVDGVMDMYDSSINPVQSFSNHSSSKLASEPTNDEDWLEEAKKRGKRYVAPPSPVSGNSGRGFRRGW